MIGSVRDTFLKENAMRNVITRYMKYFKNTLMLAVVCVLVVPSAVAEARYKGDVAGWVPYWAEEKKIKTVIKHMDEVDILYPFIYEVTSDGTIVAKVDIQDGVWEDLLDEADDERVDIIPTIAWFNGQEIHDTLSDRKKRRAFVRAIAELVDDNNFDGINIDFEGKKSETIDYFSDFLEELDDELGRDELTCTIEARTPPDSLYKPDEIPNPIKYANDYKAMNKYCDWVEIMAYDQQRADLKLNEQRRGLPYAPVADIDWVEKVIELAVKDIDEDKIMLGIPTYGRAWDITVAPEWYRDYKRVASLNWSRIEELSDIYDVPIGRSAGGEAVISYFPEDSVYKVFNALSTPEGTPKGYEAAAKALLVATYTGYEIPVRFVMAGDAISAQDKVDLAEKYNLKGIAFFKWDGEEDEDIWDLF